MLQPNSSFLEMNSLMLRIEVKLSKENICLDPYIYLLLYSDTDNRIFLSIGTRLFILNTNLNVIQSLMKSEIISDLSLSYLSLKKKLTLEEHFKEH